jgi:xylulose-5-phosphate/fructose-6-phosphate phosphoketolase
MTTSTLAPDMLRKIDAYWRAANYVSVGQIYLYDNPLLKRPLAISDVKPLVVSHWGTTPGQNFIYVHLNRVINKYDLDMFYVAGPGHGGPAIVGNVYLEGTWSDVYPNVTQDEAGLKELFKQFSFPGGISSHVAPTTPGSIHEGGELGYSLSHAFGAVFDNPGLIVACVIGDGEAETGPLATAWQSNKFLDPVTDGAVLPILHLNGYKISNPTVLARIEREELEQFLRGCGWAPLFVEGDDPDTMHELMARAMDSAIEDIGRMQNIARNQDDATRPRWPMIVLRSPKGWTGPKVVDGLPIEGTFRSHQVPMLVDSEHLDHVPLLESWMKSYRISPRRVTGAWVPTRTPTAVCCCTISKCRTFTNTRSRSPHRARSRRATRRFWGNSCGTSRSSTGATATSAFSVRTKHSRTCSAPSSKSPTGSGMPGKSRTTNSSRPRGRCSIRC